MTEEQLLEKARKYYPVGTKYISLTYLGEDGSEREAIRPATIVHSDSKSHGIDVGFEYIYTFSNDRWATIVSKAPQAKFIVGKWYTGFHAAPRSYGKLLEEVKSAHQWPCTEYIEADPHNKYHSRGSYFSGSQENIVEADMDIVRRHLPEGHPDKGGSDLIIGNWYIGTNPGSEWLFQSNGVESVDGVGMFQSCILPSGERTMSAGLIGKLINIKPAPIELVCRHFPEVAGSQYWIRTTSGGTFINKYYQPITKNKSGRLVAYINEKKGLFDKESHAGDEGSFVYPSMEDIAWLDKCITLNKFISREQFRGMSVVKASPSIGRWLRAKADYASSISAIRKGDYVKIVSEKDSYWKVGMKPDYHKDSDYVVAVMSYEDKWEMMPEGFAPGQDKAYMEKLPTLWCIKLEKEEQWETMKKYPKFAKSYAGNGVGSYYSDRECADNVRAGYVALTMEEFKRLVLGAMVESPPSPPQPYKFPEAWWIEATTAMEAKIIGKWFDDTQSGAGGMYEQNLVIKEPISNKKYGYGKGRDHVQITFNEFHEHVLRPFQNTQKTSIPEYVKCTAGSNQSSYSMVGRVYKVESYDPIGGSIRILGKEIYNIFFDRTSTGSNCTNFTPSTKQEYDEQEKTPHPGDWCVKVTNENRDALKLWGGNRGWAYSTGAYYGVHKGEKKATSGLHWEPLISSEEFHAKMATPTTYQVESGLKIGDWVTVTGNLGDASKLLGRVFQIKQIASVSGAYGRYVLGYKKQGFENLFSGSEGGIYLKDLRLATDLEILNHTGKVEVKGDSLTGPYRVVVDADVCTIHVRSVSPATLKNAEKEVKISVKQPKTIKL